MIPPIAHFIWYGSEFPWVHYLSILSSIENGGFQRVILHHDNDLEQNPFFQQLLTTRRFESYRIDLQTLFENLDLDPALWMKLHDSLTSLTARSNLLRIAILAQQGGVYLDLDTITLRSLQPFQDVGFYCGVERIIFPYHIVHSRSISNWANAISLYVLRDICRRIPVGWRLFKRVQHLYPEAVNNAILGAESRHPLLLGMLERIRSLPVHLRQVRFALGTHLLQQMVEFYDGDDLMIHDSEVFYPLAPEISRHWFASTHNADIDRVISENTRVIHWYSSVRNRRVIEQMEPQYVLSHAKKQLISALIARYCPGALQPG